MHRGDFFKIKSAHRKNDDIKIIANILATKTTRLIGAITCLIISTNVALSGLTSTQLKSASGLFNLMRNMGGAIGLAVLTTLLFNNRYELHYDHLISMLTARRLAIVSPAQLTERLTEADTGDVALQTASLLARTVAREALVQSFADMFLLVGSCFFVSLLLVFFLRKTPPVGEFAH
jgi:MFS transporter, DHA2 family, multidrug resistance protein